MVYNFCVSLWVAACPQLKLNTGHRPSSQVRDISWGDTSCLRVERMGPHQYILNSEVVPFIEEGWATSTNAEDSRLPTEHKSSRESSLCFRVPVFSNQAPDFAVAEHLSVAGVLQHCQILQLLLSFLSAGDKDFFLSFWRCSLSLWL